AHAAVEEEQRWHAMSVETPAEIAVFVDVAVKPLQPECPDLVRFCEHRLLRDFAVEALETPEKNDGQFARRGLEAGIERLSAQFLHVESGEHGGVDGDIGHDNGGFANTLLE